MASVCLRPVIKTYSVGIRMQAYFKKYKEYVK